MIYETKYLLEIAVKTAKIQKKTVYIVQGHQFCDK